MSLKKKMKNRFKLTMDHLLKPSNLSKNSFDTLFAAERKRIVERRLQAGLDPGDPAKDSAGMALSGGGIRSATFNLGLLQAMERYRVLKNIDYLSTVSGGGYIGSCLTWFMSVQQWGFPFGTRRADHNSFGGRVLAWIRAHGKYLTPGKGLSLWSLVAAVLCGTMVNLLVMVPAFLLFVWVLALNIPEMLNVFIPPFLMWDPEVTYFALLLVLGHLFLLLFFVMCIFYGLLSQHPKMQSVCAQREFRITSGIVLMVSVILLVIGSIPYAHHFLQGRIPELISSFSFSGFISLAGGLFFSKREKNANNLLSPVLLSFGLALVSYALFLFFYHVVAGCGQQNSSIRNFWPALLPLSLALALFANINHVSMHRFYRNRLMEAYMPTIDEKGIYTDDEEQMSRADTCLLKDIGQSAAPYHLINTTIQTVGSDQQKLRERGGDSFLFSPLYCGSEETGYIPTAKFMNGRMNLATAMAISGAAVDCNTLYTRSRPLTFLMSLFNIRLGYWLPNPRYGQQKIRPLWWWYMFREMFGKGLNEKCRNVHLSDGGHFENLGLYELARRKCRTIVVADAGADPKYLFSDLARAIERLRVDFGARVDISTAQLNQDAKDGYSPVAWVRGTITYNDEEKTVADLLYIKTTLFAGLPEDILAYRRVNRDFPDQTTSDQFFDEVQFEAYRELGFQIGRKLFADRTSWEEVFQNLE